MTLEFPKDQEPKEEEGTKKNQNYYSVLRQIKVLNF